MQAIRVRHFGGPDALAYELLPTPQPGRGEVRVKLEAIGVNFIDIYKRTGRYHGSLPFIPGEEGAGVVDAVGLEVNDLKPGDRVAYAMQQGAYAEYAVVPAWKLMPLPPGVNARQAAAVMLQGMTAHYLTHSTFPLQPGHTALVHAAAGGVGLLLVQVAKKRGARVIGTTSTREKADLAKKAGADEVILYTETDFEMELKRLTGGKGVDVVFDSVGQPTFDKGLNCLKPRGFMVLFGQSGGAVPPLDPQVLNAKGSLFLTRPTLAHYSADRRELEWRAGSLFRWLEAGELDVRVDRTYSLAEAADAQAYLESRQSKGKILLIP